MTKLAVTLDTETFPNCFLLVARVIDTELTFVFEISDYRNDSDTLYAFLCLLRDTGSRAYGFNIVGFDGPVIHTFMKMGGKATARILYDKAIAIIQSQDEDRWSHQVYNSDRDFQWVCLYRINHFDNRARATSLKALEFSMRMDNISDLPFPVGTILNPEQIKVLTEYCIHDVKATELFRLKCLPMIEFRESLTAKYQEDFMNFADVKIGSKIFEMELEKAGVQCYEYGAEGRKPRQTQRPFLALKDCVPGWIHFDNSEFNRVCEWFKQQVVTETKGVFKDLTANIGGLEFVFGTGGIHASVENEIFDADEEMMIYDMDVAGMYPSIAIANEFYPEHLGTKFVEIYKQIVTERSKFKKGTPENAAYKLAANGAYGKSNDKFSIFYDPLFTMKITIGGQLMLAMLVERLLSIQGLRICQANTDGVTVYMPRAAKSSVDVICRQWETETKLVLEFVEYSKMAIADVNSYIAVYADKTKETKRKGRYEYELEWHQNHSCLVVPKVAEKVLLEDVPIRDTVQSWPDIMDFMLRIKVPRSSKLVNQDGKGIQNTCRYYVAIGGETLFKMMPPLKDKTEWRRFAVEKGRTVCVCNDIRDAVLSIDYDYYVNEVEKLTVGLR